MDNADDTVRSAAPLETLALLRAFLSVSAIEAIAREVIDRLIKIETDAWQAPRDEVESLCRALCARYPFAADKMIEDLLSTGVPVQRIYGAYLAEAARLLGDRWERNHLKFEAVGIATTRIYAIVDMLRRRKPTFVTAESPRIAFAAVPGGRRQTSVTTVVDAFQRAGWDALHLTDQDHRQIVDRVADQDIALIGLSVPGGRSRAALIKLVVALRVTRPDIKILLSEVTAGSEPDFLSQIGIDEIVCDPSDALKAVERLLPRAGAAAG